MEDKILLDKNTLKALIVESRLDILKLLTQKNYTLSEISEKLNLKKSTVKDHLDILSNAGLIKKEDTDRKWKYYSLTFKGKRVIEPKEVKVLFAFIINVVALIGTGAFFIKQILSETVTKATNQENTIMVAKDTTEVITGNSSVFPISMWTAGIVTGLLLFTAGALLAYYIKRKVFIIGGEK